MPSQPSMRLCKRCVTESVVIALSVPEPYARPIPVYGALLITPEADDTKPQLIIHCRYCKLGFTHTINPAFWLRATPEDMAAIINRTLNDIRDYGRSLVCVLCNTARIELYQMNGITFAICSHCGWRAFASSNDGDPVAYFMRANRVALAIVTITSKTRRKRAR